MAFRTIYEKLSDVVKDERLVDLYRGRCQEVLPQLRYCAYNLGEETADINQLMQMKLQIGGQDDVMGSDLDVTPFSHDETFVFWYCSAACSSPGRGLFKV